MGKKYGGFLFAFLFVLVLSGCSFKNQANVPPATDDSLIIFFYGKECPHCQKVEEYFSQNAIFDKVSFSQREVYHDRSNAQLMAEKAETCGIKKDELGVPMLWTEGQCLFGDKDIIDFFEKKIK